MAIKSLTGEKRWEWEAQVLRRIEPARIISGIKQGIDPKNPGKLYPVWKNEVLRVNRNIGEFRNASGNLNDAEKQAVNDEMTRRELSLYDIYSSHREYIIPNNSDYDKVPIPQAGQIPHMNKEELVAFEIRRQSIAQEQVSECKQTLKYFSDKAEKEGFTSVEEYMITKHGMTYDEFGKSCTVKFKV